MPNMPCLLFRELTKRCNLACVHCRAQYAAGDYLEEEPSCVYQPKRTAP